MKEIAKYDNWFKFLSISVIVIVVCVFTLTVSNTHLAKGTYGLSNSYSDLTSDQRDYYKGLGYTCSMTSTINYKYKCICNETSGCTTTSGTTQPYGYTLDPVAASSIGTMQGYGYKCSSYTVDAKYACTCDSPKVVTNDGCVEYGYCYYDNTTYMTLWSTSKPTSSFTIISENVPKSSCNVGKCISGYRQVNNLNQCEPDDSTSSTGGSNTGTCYQCAVVDKSCDSGYKYQYSWKQGYSGCSSIGSKTQSACSGSGGCVPSDKTPTTRPTTAPTTNPDGSSGSTPNPATQSSTDTPTTNPTSTSTNTPSNNPQTGTAGIIVAWIVGLFAIVYSLWYIKRSSSIN